MKNEIDDDWVTAVVRNGSKTYIYVVAVHCQKYVGRLVMWPTCLCLRSRSLKFSLEKTGHNIKRGSLSEWNSCKKKNNLSSTTRVAFYPCFFHLWCHSLMVLPLQEAVHCSVWWLYQWADIIGRFQLSAFIITHKCKFEKQRRGTRNIFRSCYEWWCCILPPTEASL